MNKVVNVKSATAESAGLLHYSHYQLSLQERLVCITLSALVFGAVGYLFYQHTAIALGFCSIGLGAPRFRRDQLIRIRKNKLNVQFRQALSCLSASLTAGKSVESAFREALLDLKLLYPDPSTYIVKEFAIILRRIENGEPVEAAVREFARRAEMEDVTGFADVLLTCKRTGGNLVEVMKRTSAMIGDKLEIQQDISVMVAQKKFESNLLLIAPFCMVALLGISSPDYMEPMYHGVGHIIMTACLILLGICFWLIRRIMNIRI